MTTTLCRGASIIFLLLQASSTPILSFFLQNRQCLFFRGPCLTLSSRAFLRHRSPNLRETINLALSSIWKLIAHLFYPRIFFARARPLLLLLLPTDSCIRMLSLSQYQPSSATPSTTSVCSDSRTNLDSAHPIRRRRSSPTLLATRVSLAPP